MYHRDFTIRLLQQMIVMLARLLGLKKKDDPAVIVIEMESAFPQFLGIPRSLALRMSGEGMLALFSATGELDANRAGMAVVLLREEVQLAERLGSPEEAALLRDRTELLARAALASPLLQADLRQMVEPAG